MINHLTVISGPYALELAQASQEPPILYVHKEGDIDKFSSAKILQSHAHRWPSAGDP